MKKGKLLVVALLAGSLFTACSSSSDRLAHKWVVTYASYLPGTPPDPADTTVDSTRQLYQDAYQGCKYDIHQDGTFATDGIDGKRSGKWKESDGVVVLTYSDNNKTETWEFPEHEGIKIYGDSSLEPNLLLGGGDKLELILKPQHGEKVKTDY